MQASRHWITIDGRRGFKNVDLISIEEKSSLIDRRTMAACRDWHDWAAVPAESRWGCPDDDSASKRQMSKLPQQ